MSLDLPVVASAAAAGSGTNPHFARIGGREAVQRLVDAFYTAMDTRADARAIRAMHHADLTETRRILVAYLCEWMGGPADYSAERGAPRLRRRHQPFPIDGAARDAWLACMDQALQATCPDAALRHELMQAFARVARAVSPPPAATPPPFPTPVDTRSPS